MPDHIDHTITVNFNHRLDSETERFVDSIDYQPAVLWVTAGDEVQWISNYDLRITFQKGTPFGRIRIETTAGVLSSPVAVLASAEPRGYHYHVSGAKMEGSTLRFAGDPGCPEIIVECTEPRPPLP